MNIVYSLIIVVAISQCAQAGDFGTRFENGKAVHNTPPRRDGGGFGSRHERKPRPRSRTVVIRLSPPPYYSGWQRARVDNMLRWQNAAARQQRANMHAAQQRFYRPALRWIP